MSVYLYNLMFSLNGSNVNVGSFEPFPSPLPPNPSIANLVSAWFTATSSPPGLQPYFQAMTQPLSASLWGSAQSDANDLALNPGDFLMVRVFSRDPNVSNYQMRFTGVFGRGTGQLLAAWSRQSAIPVGDELGLFTEQHLSPSGDRCRWKPRFELARAAQRRLLGDLLGPGGYRSRRCRQ